MLNIESLIQLDAERRDILIAVASLNLPDCYVAAGFVRNMVWDYLHGFDPTPLNDVDVIYFDKSTTLSPETIKHRLQCLLPSVSWEVKNQALMHIRNGDAPYLSTEEAMRYWPEKETAVGVRLLSSGNIDLVAPFGVDSLFSGFITHNPNRTKAVFEQRVHAKGWLQTWPNLKVVS